MKSVKWMTISGVILCGICCLLPIIGATATITAFGSFVSGLETIGIVLLVLSAILFGIHYWRKRKSCKTCGSQCSCKQKTLNPVN